ncbi:MAG: VWA domain-containing protein [Pyrinomonadaceae bacterium]|nr:VWA domain-containing protein [Pyrinomonadaceae bacterium]
MRKLTLALAFYSLAASSVFAQTPPPKPAEDDDVVKISTTLIQVDVTVTDKRGKIITDLKPEDFEIYENGERQDITNFSFVANVKTQPAPTPKTSSESPPPPPPTPIKSEQVRRTIALVVDDLSLSFQSASYVRNALKKFVNELMQDGDLVAIIRTGAGIGALQQFTTDKRQLLAAAERVRFNPLGTGGTGAFAPIQNSAAGQTNASDDQDEETGGGAENEANDFRESVFVAGTLGAINFIVRGMNQLPRRKSVMLLSDGFQLFSRQSNGALESSRILYSLRRLVDLANRSSVVIYTMDARGLQTLGLTAEDDVGGLNTNQIQQQLTARRDRLSDTQEGLIYLARETGGLPIYNNNDLNQGIERMLDDQSYYLIGYQPDAETFDAAQRRFNKFVVKVNRKNARVRYRSGFFNLTDEQVKTLPAKETPARQIQAALTSPFAAGGIGLRLNTLFANDARQGSFVRSLLHVNAKDLKFVEEADGIQKAVFDILAVSFGDNGAVVDEISKTYTLRVKGEAYRKVVSDGFVYNFSFPIKKAGAYQYRVVIRDSETQKIGSANQFIEVPNLKKERLTVSGIVLENLTAEQWRRRATDAPPATVPTGASEPETTDPLTDTSLRRFQRGTILRYAFEIYNAKSDAARKPNLTTQIKVFRDGKPILEGTNVPLDLLGQTDLQRIKFAGALSLGGEISAGEYVPQIVITDNLAKKKRQIATQFVQFEIQ